MRNLAMHEFAKMAIFDLGGQPDGPPMLVILQSVQPDGPAPDAFRASQCGDLCMDLHLAEVITQNQRGERTREGHPQLIQNNVDQTLQLALRLTSKEE